MKKHWRIGKTEAVGFGVGLALLGGGAVAVALNQGDEDAPVAAEQAERLTAPTVASELDGLGLARLDPATIVRRETIGRMRVVPAGGPLEWDSSFEPQANLQAGELPIRNDNASGLPTADGAPFMPSLNADFVIEETGSIAKRVDGVTQFVSGSMRLSKVGESRTITAEYWQLRPGSVVEVTALNGSSVWNMSSATGTTGFLQTMSPRADFESVLNADFVVGDIYFRIRAPGTSPTEMLALVSAFRRELTP